MRIKPGETLTLIHPASNWTHWATLRRHPCLSKAAASASSWVNPIFCRSLFTGESSMKQFFELFYNSYIDTGHQLFHYNTGIFILNQHYKESIKYSQLLIKYNGSTHPTSIAKWCRLHCLNIRITVICRQKFFTKFLLNYFFQC